ncbi:hypothetical protein QR685DRAFT_572053 [Neurospora intermedia]|uniref:Uncharacterized protein n=1 Tax=Neurospora intermedia TaxID=5142 RepID=A0ABR3DEC9_NEUIN
MLLADLVPEQVPRSLVSLAGRPASPTAVPKPPDDGSRTDSESPNVEPRSHQLPLCRVACLPACCPYHSAAFRCFAFTTGDDNHHHHCRLEPTSDPLSGPSIHHPVHGHGHPGSSVPPATAIPQAALLEHFQNAQLRDPISSPPSFGRPKTGHGPNHLKKGSLRDWGPERD